MVDSRSCLTDGLIEVEINNRVQGLYFPRGTVRLARRRFLGPDWVCSTLTSEAHIARYQHGHFSGWALYYWGTDNDFIDGPPNNMKPIFIADDSDLPQAANWRHNDIQPEYAFRSKRFADGVPYLRFLHPDHVAAQRCLGRHDERLARQVFRQRLQPFFNESMKGWLSDDNDLELFQLLGVPRTPRRAGLLSKLVNRAEAVSAFLFGS